jgi:hypothetical protein
MKVARKRVGKKKRKERLVQKMKKRERPDRTVKERPDWTHSWLTRTSALALSAVSFIALEMYISKLKCCSRKDNKSFSCGARHPFSKTFFSLSTTEILAAGDF